MYRTDVRAVNELDFGPGDPRLEQRIGALVGDLHLHAVVLRGEIELLRAQLRAEMKMGDAKLHDELSRAEFKLWMFVLWLATVVPLGGLMIAVMMR